RRVKASRGHLADSSSLRTPSRASQRSAQPLGSIRTRTARSIRATRSAISVVRTPRSRANSSARTAISRPLSRWISFRSEREWNGWLGFLQEELVRRACEVSEGLRNSRQEQLADVLPSRNLLHGGEVMAKQRIEDAPNQAGAGGWEP